MHALCSPCQAGTPSLYLLLEKRGGRKESLAQAPDLASKERILETYETCVPRKLPYRELLEMAIATGRDFTELARQNKEFLISKGLCQTCGKRTPKEGCQRCPRCLDARKRAARRYGDANKQYLRQYHRDYYFAKRGAAARALKVQIAQTTLEPLVELERAKAILAARHALEETP